MTPGTERAPMTSFACNAGLLPCTLWRVGVSYVHWLRGGKGIDGKSARNTVSISFIISPVNHYIHYITVKRGCHFFCPPVRSLGFLFRPRLSRSRRSLDRKCLKWLTTQCTSHWEHLSLLTAFNCFVSCQLSTWRCPARPWRLFVFAIHCISLPSEQWCRPFAIRYRCHTSCTSLKNRLSLGPDDVTVRI